VYVLIDLIDIREFAMSIDLLPPAHKSRKLIDLVMYSNEIDIIKSIDIHESFSKT
jgi:hypothetical protein